MSESNTHESKDLCKSLLTNTLSISVALVCVMLVGLVIVGKISLSVSPSRNFNVA